MPFVNANGARFHYQQVGQGPDVVLLHAVTSNLSVWLFINLLDAIAQQGFRVTAYDLRGHGMSEATPAGYTSAEMAGDFRQIQAELGLGPAYLVGHSFGGVTALHAATLFPEQVVGLVLADPYFPGLAHLEPNLAQAFVWTDLQTTFAAAGLELGELVDFTRLFQCVAQLTTEQKEIIRAAMGPNSLRWLVQLPRLSETSCGADVFAVAGLTAERIVSVRQPVAALYDEHSPFLATCRFLEANLPDCAVEFVPGANHLAPVQNGPAFAALVVRHLTRMHQRRAAPAAAV